MTAPGSGVWKSQPCYQDSLTNKNSEAAPCARAEIKGIRIIRVSSTHSANSLQPVSGEVSEPRGRPIRSDGDSSHAAMPGGSGTWVRQKRLTKLTGFHPALPAPRTGMCDCHTVLHTFAALTVPHKWSWWRMSAGGEIMTKCLGQTHPKRSAAEMGVKFRTIKALRNALSTRQSITELYK